MNAMVSVLLCRTLIRIESSSVIELKFSSSQLQLVVGSDISKVSDGLSFDGDWEYVVFSFITDNFFPEGSGMDDPPGVEFYINDMQVSAACSLSMFPSSISAVTIGSGYSGLLQDVVIEARSIRDSDVTNLTRTEADFLPECLCPLGTSLSKDEESCDAMPR